MKLGGILSGVTITPSGKAPAAPPAPVPNDVLSFSKPPVAEPSQQATAAPDPADVLALRNMVAELGRVVEKLRTREQAKIESVAQTTVELAVALAERLVNAEIAADRQRLDRIVREALERIQPARAVTVRGHDDDLALLQHQINDQPEIAVGGNVFTFRPDKACERGQLKIEVDERFIDFDTQRSLMELRDRLLEETFANE
jgi:flagellar biosynthesis/type III secretory pathway protein FliH